MAREPGNKTAKRMGLAILIGAILAIVLVATFMKFGLNSRPDRPDAQTEAR